jgi:hypothetical protein
MNLKQLEDLARKAARTPEGRRLFTATCDALLSVERESKARAAAYHRLADAMRRSDADD